MKVAGELGVKIPASAFFRLLAAVWYLLNELQSIIENVGRMGANVPEWLRNSIAVRTNRKTKLRRLADIVIMCLGKPIEPRRLTLLYRRGNPPDERKEGLPMYVTYSDLIQIGIFIVALVGLIYEIFKGKK